MTLKGHTRPVRDVHYGYTSGGIFLASCNHDLTIKLWKPADGYKNFRTLLGHDHITSAVRFISTRNLLASASKDADIRLWDVMKGHCVKTIHGHTGWIRDISPSFDGQLVLSTGDNMTFRLWDISTANPASKLIAVGHENFNMCCAIAPSAPFQYLAPLVGLKSSTSAADFMATRSRDKTIKLWDYRGVCIITLVDHDNWVRAIVFHPSGRYLLSVSNDKTLCCWDLSQQGQCIKTLRDTHSGLITCLKWVPAIVKDLRTGSEQPLRDRDLPEVQIRCVMATGSVDQMMYIFAG
ncbi:nuclear distribution protein PAC1 variant [Penicillium odoratum]|uniref:nuclear distribution protein PAC1 variant n=1 Tax=Penicillium odoratum TaxID=1167516 RepID=UPI002548A70C|nr:nuclear distribution protein PAC1 variant [Penicillium odoratum]KAJ5765093.1 nuclear distribution protein PAC1 variant [Penicillium odoratum]